jgi:hypothetical protein
MDHAKYYLRSCTETVEQASVEDRQAAIAALSGLASASLERWSTR